jgi:replicative DNA helicase
MLIENIAICKTIDILEASDFYKPAHGIIYNAMIVLFQSRMPIDLTTLSETLRKMGELENVGGEYYLSELTCKVSSAANVEYHAHIVLERSFLRQLISAANEISSRAYIESEDTLGLLEEAEKKIFDINQKRVSGNSVSMAQAVVKFQDMFDRQRASNEVSGVRTDLIELDNITAGLQPTDLIILAGRPSMGKTACALSIAKNVSKRGESVGFFSLEMSTNQLVIRVLSPIAKVDAHEFRTPYKMSQNDVEAVVEAGRTAYTYPLYIDDSSSISILELRAKARRMYTEHKIKLLFVDYLQLMQGEKSANNREQEVSSVSRGLKAIAKDLKIPVVALSQLNRGVETRQIKRPVLADLRESGAIEQDADVVMFIHRPETYGEDTLCDKITPSENAAELIIAKHRNGAANLWLPLRFIKQYTRYENYSNLPERTF